MQEETYPQQEGGQEWQQQQQQPPQQPHQQQWQQSQPQPKPQHDFFQGLASNKTLALAVMVGLMIIMVGAILINAASFSDNFETVDNIMTTGRILQDIGVFLVSGMMLLAAFYREDWNVWIRVGLAGFALVLIVVGYFPIGLEFGMDTGAGGW